MVRHRIDEEESGVAIELTEVGGHQEQLMQAFAECQAGQCSCPTNEYEKLASMEVKEADDSTRLRLEAKPGERFDTSEIEACLDYTTARVAEGQAGA